MGKRSLEEILTGSPLSLAPTAEHTQGICAERKLVRKLGPAPSLFLSFQSGGIQGNGRQRGGKKRRGSQRWGELNTRNRYTDGLKRNLGHPSHGIGIELGVWMRVWALSTSPTHPGHREPHAGWSNISDKKGRSSSQGQHCAGMLGCPRVARCLWVRLTFR